MLEGKRVVARKKLEHSIAFTDCLAWKHWGGMTIWPVIKEPLFRPKRR